MSKLNKEMQEDINRVGTSNILTWLRENNFQISANPKNLYEELSAAIDNKTLTVAQLQNGVAELEESGEKKILLFKAKNFESLEKNKRSILLGLRKKFGIERSEVDWITKKPGERSTFIYLYWADNKLKIKFGEMHFDTEYDYEAEKPILTPKRIYIVISIDTATGFTELRLGTPGERHRHRNEENKPTEAAYEAFYGEKLRELFPDLTFMSFDLNRVANYLANKEKIAFRITKTTSTISHNAKQTFTISGKRTDARDLPEYIGAEAK